MEIGTRIGAYEVIAKLGEGGMGEVYRASDPHLKRSVAVARGALPLGDALSVARQIAEALEAAHEQEVPKADVLSGWRGRLKTKTRLLRTDAKSLGTRWR